MNKLSLKLVPNTASHHNTKCNNNRTTICCKTKVNNRINMVSLFNKWYELLVANITV